MLIDAINRGRLFQVKFLLESGSVNVNVTDRYGQTPLMKAILIDDRMHHTRCKIVRLLLDHGARVNVADKAGRTALMLAVIYGQKEIAEKILNSALMDIDLNAGDYEGNTALIHSALEGHDSITSMLITSLKRFGLDIDKKNHRGFTAMLEAVRHGRERCARVLHVEGGASLTIRDPETFMSAKEWAVENELFGLIELIEKNKQEPVPVKTVDTTSRKTSDEVVNVVLETSNLEPPTTNVDVRSGPQSPYDVTSRPGSTSKQAIKNALTVPRIMRNLRNQEEQAAFGVNTNSRSATSRDLIQNKSRALSISPENEGKETSSAGSCANREGTLLLSKRRSLRPRASSARLSERSSNAKTEIQRLLCLYGVQNSVTYRIGYDPALLPPSGMWPDPNAINLSDSTENINTLGTTDFFGELPFGVGRRSALSSSCSKRMSIVGGNTREGRRMSIISQGNMTTGRNPVMGRKISTAQQFVQPKNLSDVSGRRPGDRRMSVAPMKASTMERPVLRRMNTSTSAASLLRPLVVE